MTIRENALNNIISPQMKEIAEKENVSVEYILNEVKFGRIAIFKNKIRNIKSCANGKGLTTKVNANIGTSPLHCDIDYELKKLKIASDAGADTIMDLSIGGDINSYRKIILENTDLPVGTVPVYQCAFEKICKGSDIFDLKEEDFLKVIEVQSNDGVDFMTIHAGITKESIDRLKKQGRILNVVSRGGSILVKWMMKTGKENPYYSYFDDVCKILKKNDVVISLGDGLRPGCLSDATDRAQLNELLILGELTKRAWDNGVQVIIEGPGHIPLNEIKMNIELEKKICNEAPFYVLGPLVTDITPGYDHISGAIGGALAASYGADFLCYLTPAEHLRLPTIDDVYEGVVVTKIAAHIGDMMKGIPNAILRDKKMAKARKDLNWDEMFKLSIDPIKAKKMREESGFSNYKECSMCGDFCSIKNLNNLF